ncbi:MAG: hypothetical protein RR940_03210 [Bacilli bacterium]
MKKKKNTYKKLALVLALILLPIGAFTLGYFFKKTEADQRVTNTLKVDGKIDGITTTDVPSNTNGIVPGDEVTLPVGIIPESTADSLLRVKVEPYWMDSQGKENNNSADNIKILFEESVKNILEESSEKSKDYWYYNENDGYLYYMNTVKNTNNKLALIKGVKFLGKHEGGIGTASENIVNEIDNNSYQDMNIGLKVTMDMVQCGDYAYKSKWSESNISGNLKDKLDSLCSKDN